MTTHDAIALLRQLFPLKLHDRFALVGGSVRDMLLRKESQDLDLVSDLPHAELLGLGFRLVEAKSAATIYFRHCHEHGKIEVTHLESLAGVEDDLARRDFTINAMAMDLKGRLLDPLGGQSDLQAGLLRPCSSQAFKADPLRLFRAFRFECNGWHLAEAGENLIRAEELSASLAAIPMERFSSEMLKALAGQVPERFFQRMLEFDAGSEFLPEIFCMPGIPAGPIEHHPERDLFTHSVQVLQRVARQTDDTLARFCAFFHDIGKLATEPALYPKHHGHDEAGFAMAVRMCERLRLPAGYRRALAWTSRLHGKANRWGELRNSSRLKLAKQAVQAGIAEILPKVSAADKLGVKALIEWETVVAVSALNSLELGIDQMKLNSMPAVSRGAYVLQKRVERLRRIQSRNSVALEQ